MTKNSPFKSMFRSLKHRNFRLFFTGQLISLIGTWMQSVAQAWLIYQLTHSAALLGLTSFIGQAPSFMIAPFAGVTADRHNRRDVLVVTQICAMLLAFILATLTLSHVVQVWQVMILAACLGIVNAFDMSARQAFVVEMVGREDLSNAIALNSSIQTGARTAGPAIAGLLVAFFGEGWCFLANGISYFAVIASLLLMRLAPKEPYSSKNSTWEHIVEGFVFVMHTPSIRSLLLLMGLSCFAGMPYMAFMPIFAEEIHKGGATGLGFLMAMSGLGALLGALVLSAKTGTRGLGHIIAYACLSFGVNLILFSLSHIFWLSAILLILVGFSQVMQFASTNTLIQSIVPDQVRGRVMSFYYMMFIGTTPFGSLIGGYLAKFLGVPFIVACGGSIIMVGALLFWRFVNRNVELLTAHQAELTFPPMGPTRDFDVRGSP